MSSGERPGTAGNVRRSGGGRFGATVVPLARVKFEKSSTTISVVEDDASSEFADDVTSDPGVVSRADDMIGGREAVVVVAVVVVVVDAVAAVVVDVEILILGRFLMPVPSLGRLSDTWLLMIPWSPASGLVV